MEHAVYIIAEAGVNHNGSLKLAKELAKKAKEAGADAVKYQTFVAERLVKKDAQKAEYQKEMTGARESQLEMLKKVELSYDEFRELKEYCDTIGIEFLSTPFDQESIEFLDELGISIFKVPSGEVTNLPYLERIAQKGKKIIMSTGMCEVEEIEEALEILQANGAKDVVLLHCNTEYPTPYRDVNLRAMQMLKDEFEVAVGYSDHTAGIEIPIAATALGAEVIEKHFTLDKTMEGPDHKASLEPDELKNMVEAIRNIEVALGDGVKRPSESERKNIQVARKSIVAAVNIKKGEVFTEANLTVKRPGTGISPMRWKELLGQKAARDYVEDEMIEL